MAVSTNGTTKSKMKVGSTIDREDRDEREQAALAAMEAAASQATTTRIVLPELNIQTIHIRIIGDSPLICHRWSEKAKRLILDKQMGKASAGKENKNPEADFESSLYPYPGGGYGFPAIAFKQSAVTACTSLGKAVTKVAARQAFHVDGEKGLVKIEGEPTIREDMVRVGMGTADIRHRGEFLDWSAILCVRFNANLLSAEQVVNLFRYAGFAVGVGEWRVEKDGQNGLFRIA